MRSPQAVTSVSRVRFTHHICTWLIAMQQEQIQNFSYAEWRRARATVIVAGHLGGFFGSRTAKAS